MMFVMPLPQLMVGDTGTKMNRFVFVFVCAVIFSTMMRETSAGLSVEQIRQALKMMRNACVPKSGASVELVEGIQEGKFPDDKNLKCYTKCVMSMMQTMKNGKYKPDAAIAQVKIMLPDDIKDRAVASLDGCRRAGQGVKDACELAFIVTKCVYDNDPEVFLFA